MDNIRYNISPCMANEAKRFVENLDETLYSPRNTVMADEKSHYDRYSFLRGESKVAVVYDTSAQVISITASQEYADELLRLFKPADFQTIKRSTVPAQCSQRTVIKNQKPIYSETENGDVRAKVFVAPRPASKPYGATVIATSKGAEIFTDEIFPPQRAKKKSTAEIKNTSYSRIVDDYNGTVRERRAVEPTLTGISSRIRKSESELAPTPISGLNISAASGSKTAPRRAVISFGDEEDYKTKQRNVAPKTGTGNFGGLTSAQSAGTAQHDAPQAVKRRGRPPKTAPATATADVYVPEYKSVTAKASQNVLTRLLNELKRGGARIAVETGNAGEFNYTVADKGQKATVKYSQAAETILLQGKQSELYAKIASIMTKLDGVSPESAEKSAKSAQGPIRSNAADKALKQRLPTAYEFLSEQSRLDFLYGLNDFSKRNLQPSDYSVLLVPPFRGLERFVFDLQRAEGIKVKMIGQAFDKDADGKYVLKSGYTQRIGSVVYAEVMVALYTEYFSQRNFFAHSDNSDDNVSRSITDRNTAKAIFDRLLAVVEYNAKKLKEIGFDITPKE